MIFSHNSMTHIALRVMTIEINEVLFYICILIFIAPPHSSDTKDLVSAAGKSRKLVYV